MSNDKIVSRSEELEMRKQLVMMAIYDAMPDYDKLKAEGVSKDEIKTRMVQSVERIIDGATDEALKRELPKIRQAMRAEMEELIKIALKELALQTDDERAEMLETLRVLKEDAKKLPKPE